MEETEKEASRKIRLDQTRSSFRTRIEAEVLADALIPRLVREGPPGDPILIGHRRAPAKKPFCVGADGMPQLLCAVFQ